MDQSAIYRIRISGFLDNHWADRFGGLNISEKKDLEKKLVTIKKKIAFNRFMTTAHAAVTNDNWKDALTA